MELVDELRTIAPGVSAAALGSFMEQLGTIATQLDENVNPELALDVLALGWPRAEPESAAAMAVPHATTAGTPATSRPAAAMETRRR
jgi:hypothetical protein